jgi:hypothetical protein
MLVAAEAAFGGFARADLFTTGEERAEHLMPPAPRERSKKELWLAEKVSRPRGSRAPSAPQKAFAVGSRIQPLTTLFNVWTREALPILPGQSLAIHFDPFLRDHYTNQATTMDTRLVDVLTRVALRFSAPRIEVVSGYRSPKYNLMLRKKGREVARQSQHPEGTAVDFRIRGTPTKTIVQYVRSLRRGGVGYYPRSQFVHSDTGKIRYWTGT